MTPHQQVDVANESELFHSFIALIREVDPDILVGFEVQKQSIGYLIDRYDAAVRPQQQDQSPSLKVELWRLPFSSAARLDPTRPRDSWGEKKQSGIHIVGRIILNLWRILRSDVKLPRYSLWRCAHDLLGETVPHRSWATLNNLIANGTPNTIGMAIQDRMRRAHITCQLLLQQNLVQTTSGIVECL